MNRFQRQRLSMSNANDTVVVSDDETDQSVGEHQVNCCKL